MKVNNTDAEGRLTLADALLYCQQQGVTEVVDIAPAPQPFPMNSHEHVSNA